MYAPVYDHVGNDDVDDDDNGCVAGGVSNIGGDNVDDVDFRNGDGDVVDLAGDHVGLR